MLQLQRSAQLNLLNEAHRGLSVHAGTASDLQRHADEERGRVGSGRGVSVRGGDGAGDDPQVATVSSTGIVTATGPGVATISVTVNGVTGAMPIVVQ